ncbi:MAG TPA: hypothetical protein VIK57_08125 [Streptosporangiaceae bacterium]
MAASGNTAGHGGAIDNVGLLFLSGAALSGNRAELGGGLYNVHWASVPVRWNFGNNCSPGTSVPGCIG